MVEEVEVEEEEGWCHMCEQLRLPNSRESCCVSSCLYFAFHPVVHKHRHSLTLKVVHTHTHTHTLVYQRPCTAHMHSLTEADLRGD